MSYNDIVQSTQSAFIFFCRNCQSQNVQIQLSHPSLNISTGAMTSRVPVAVSGLIRQVMCIFLLLSFYSLICMHRLKLWRILPSGSIKSHIKYQYMKMSYKIPVYSKCLIPVQSKAF